MNVARPNKGMERDAHYVRAPHAELWALVSCDGLSEHLRMPQSILLRLVRRAWVAVAIVLCACIGSYVALASVATYQSSGLAFIAGTWTGTSACVGDRPACKNEAVVYRFIPVDGHPSQVRQLADKIIDGKRVPMGALVFEVDQQHHTLRSEFKVGQTHGEWSYAVKGESLTGKLVILPERSVGRDVKARRVTEAEVPAAPPLSAYGE